MLLIRPNQNVFPGLSFIISQFFPLLSVEENLVSAAAAEEFLEEFLELGVEDGVNDGVECAVDVAQPGDGAHQPRRDVARQTHGSRRVDHEERSPAEQEASCMTI